MPGGCPPPEEEARGRFKSSPPWCGAPTVLRTSSDKTAAAPAGRRSGAPCDRRRHPRYALANHRTSAPPCPESALPAERPQPVWHPYLPPVPLCRAEYGSALGTWCSSHAVHHPWQGRLISARRTARSSWRARDDDDRSMRRARRTRRAPAASRSAPAAAAAAAGDDDEAEVEAEAVAAAEAALLLLMLL